MNDEYTQSDIDRGMMERSLDISSQELLHVNSEMRSLISLLNATIESTTDGILVVNRQGKIVSFNQKFIKMWHIPQQIVESRDEEQALSLMLDQLKDPEGFLKKVRELYVTPEGESYDELIFKDGRVVERYSQPQRIGETIVGRVWSFRDITERKGAQEVVRESEERYRNLFENAHDMIQSVAPDGHFIFVNPSWLKTMGYTWDELQKITIFDILYPSCISHCTEAFQKVMSGEYLTNVEAIFVTKDGRLLNVDGNVNARFVEGKVVASHGVFRDITERKNAEEKLYQSEARLRHLVTASPAVIYALKVDGKNVTTSFVSENISQLTGYQIDEAMSPNWWVNHLHPEDGDRAVKEMEDLFLHGRLVHEYRFELKDGSYHWFSDELVLIRDMNDNPVEIVGAWTNITERKQAEKAIKVSQEEIKKRVKELEEFYEMAVGRELRMKELKEQMEEMKEEMEKLKNEMKKV